MTTIIIVTKPGVKIRTGKQAQCRVSIGGWRKTLGEPYYHRCKLIDGHFGAHRCRCGKQWEYNHKKKD